MIHSCTSARVRSGCIYRTNKTGSCTGRADSAMASRHSATHGAAKRRQLAVESRVRTRLASHRRWRMLRGRRRSSRTSCASSGLHARAEHARKAVDVLSRNCVDQPRRAVAYLPLHESAASTCLYAHCTFMPANVSKIEREQRRTPKSGDCERSAGHPGRTRSTEVHGHEHGICQVSANDNVDGPVPRAAQVVSGVRASNHSPVSRDNTSLI